MNGPAPRLRRIVVLGTLPLLAVVSACGSSGSTNGEASKSARQIFSDSERATEAASSVHVSGRITSGSDRISLS